MPRMPQAVLIVSWSCISTPLAKMAELSVPRLTSLDASALAPDAVMGVQMSILLSPHHFRQGHMTCVVVIIIVVVLIIIFFFILNNIISATATATTIATAMPLLLLLLLLLRQLRQLRRLLLVLLLLLLLPLKLLLLVLQHTTATRQLPLPYADTILRIGKELTNAAESAGMRGLTTVAHVLLVEVQLVQGSQGEGDCLAADKGVGWLSCALLALLSILSSVPRLAEPSRLRGEAPSHSSLCTP